MNHKSDLRIGMKFEADTSQIDLSRQKFKELISFLKEMQEEARRPGLGENIKKELSEAAKEAQKLETVLNSAWNEKLNKMDFSKLNLGIKQSYGSVNQLKASLESVGPEGAAAFNQLSNSVLSSNTQLRKTNSLLDKMALTMANTIRFGISSSVFNSFTGSISKAYDYVKKLDKSLNDIRIVSNASAADMERFAKYANSAAQNLGASTLDYSKAALIYYQQGLAEQQVKERADITVKMSNVLGTSAQEVSDYMTAIWNNFDNGSKALEYYADVLAKLGAETASSAEEISQGLEKFAAISNTVGLSYEYAAAALTTVTDRTRQSADVVGTAFKTLFARIQDLELGKTLEDGTTLGKYSEALESIGVNIKDQNGQLKNMDSILDEMGSKWRTLNSDQKVALAQNVAGVRQYSQLMALMENWDFFQQNVNSARDATGALQQQQEIYLDSVEAHLEKLHAEAEKTYSTLFDTETIKIFTSALTDMLKVFNSFLTGLGQGASSLTYLGSVAANVLNKQLGAGISGLIQNKENRLANAATLESERAFAEAGVASSSNEGRNTQEAYSKNLADVNSLIAAQKSLDEEEFNKLDRLRQEIQEERLAIAQIEDFGQNSDKNSKQREADLSIQKAQVKEDVENYQTIKDLMEEINEIDAVYVEELDEKKAKVAELVQLMEDFNGTIAGNEEIFSPEEIKEIEKIQKRLNKVTKDTKITEQEKSKILRAQNKVITANIADEKRQSRELEIQKEYENKIGLERRKQLNDQKESDYNLETREKARAAAISETIRGVTALTSSAAAVAGIFETIFNPNLTGWEKFKSILAVVATQSVILLRNWDSISKLPDNLINLLEGYNAKLQASIDIKNASKKATAAETIATELNTQAETRNTQSKIANTGAEVVNEGAKKKSIITTIIHTAKLWLENAALATKLFLIGAVAVALIALTVAIVKALSKETQLQKKIEETAEAAKKAKEAYSELNDKITGYQDARKAVDGLTEGTLEFYEAVVKSNEKAQELIDTLGLLPNQDYTFDTNGLITINQDSLKNKAYTQMQTVYGTQAANYQAKAEYTQQSREGGLESVYRSLSKDINSILKENGVKNYKWTSDMAQSLLKGENIQTEIQGELVTLTKIVGDVEDNTATTCDLIKPIDISKAISANKANYERLSAQLANYQRMTADSYIRGTISQEDSEYYNNLTKGIQKQIQTIVAQSIFGKEEEYQQTKNKIIGYNAGQKDYMLPVPQPGEKPKPQTSREQALKLYESSLAKGQTGNIDNTAMEWYVENVLKAEKLDTGKYNYNGKESSARNILKDNNIDITVARNAYNSNQAYQYAADLERKTRNASISAGLKSDQADYVTEARLALETAKTSGTATNMSGPGVKTFKYDKIDFQDFNAMTSEEMEVLKDQIKSTFGAEYLIAFNDYLKEIGYEYDNIARKAADLQKYNDAMDVQAQSIGTTSTALKMYDAARQNAEKGNVSYTKSQAELAAAEFKFNKAYNEGRKAFKDNEKAFNTYMKALQKGKKVSYDVAEGAGAVVDSLKNMGLQLKTEDLKNPKTLKQIKTLLNGTAKEAEKAYKQLEKKSLANILTQDFNVAENKVNSIIKKIQSMGDQEISIGDLGLGEISGTAEEIRQKLANLGLKVNEEDLAKAKKQVQDINNGAGSTADIKSNPVSEPVVSTITQSGRKEITVDPVTGKETVHNLPDLTWTETKVANDVKFTLGKDTRVSYVGKPKNFAPSPSTTGGGKTGGGGGGSSKKKEAKSKTEVDRYHVVNTQITKTDNQLKQLQKEEERLFGSDLIENYKKQWEALNEQVKNYNDKLKIAGKEYKEYRDKLVKQGVQFGDDGTISNYFTILKQKEAEYNKVVEKYNKLSAKQQNKYQKTLDKAKETFEKFKEDIDHIDELISNTIKQIEDNAREVVDSKIELAIKDFGTKIAASLDLKDLKIEFNNFLEETIYGLKDEDIFGRFGLNQKNMNALKAAVDDFADHLKHTNEQFDAAMQNGASIFGDDKGKAIDYLLEQYKDGIDVVSEYMNSQREQQELISEMYELINSKVEEIVDQYDKAEDVLNRDKKILQLMYGEQAYDKLEKINQKQVDMRMAELGALKERRAANQKYLEDLQKAREEQEKSLKDIKERAGEESVIYKQQLGYLKDLDDQIKKTEEEDIALAESIGEVFETTADTIAEKLTNAVNTALQKLNEGLTESGTGLSQAQEQWDLIGRQANIYVDTINKLQGQKDLESKYLDSINKATNPNVQRKLKAAMDDELEALEKKGTLTQYDLDRANKKYQITLAQIALEEAQQNKDTMRLRRDSQGNYRYQYVANEDNVKKAEEQLTSLYTDLYNFDKARFLEVNDNILSIEAETQNKIRDIYADTSTTFEEKEKAKELLLKNLNEQIEALQTERAVAEVNVNESAFEDLKRLYGEDSEAYAEAVADKKKTMESLIPQLKAEGNEIAANTELTEANKTAWEAAEDAALTASEEIQDSIALVNSDIEKLEEGTDETITKISEQIKEVTNDITKYSTELAEMNKTVTDNQALINALLSEKGVVEQLTEAYGKLVGVKEQTQTAYDTTHTNSETGDFVQTEVVSPTEYTDLVDEGMIAAGLKESEEPTPEPEPAPQTPTHATITDKIPSKTSLSKAQKKKLQQFLKSMGYYKSKIDGVWGSASKKALKKFQKKVGATQDGAWGPKTYKKAKAAGYDTGGYTGEWGSEGRLAILHQKELVLNAKDTENILNTVAIMRNLMSSLNDNVLSRLAGVSAGTVRGLGASDTAAALEQNVHIEANFPNATNSKEIEDALKNLVNVASQRITK